MMIYLTLITTLLTFTVQVRVQCQNQATSWTSNRRYQLNERQVLVSTIYGLDVFVDRQDGLVSGIITNTGSWQPHILRNMARFVEPGYTVVNIGSHIGLQAVVMGKSLGPNGKLYMFEPLGVSHNLALKNIYLNGLADITIVFKAGGSSNYSKAVQVVDLGNTGGSRVYPNQKFQNNDPNRFQQVEVDLIDSMLPKDTQINFALIDTQRMELEVFNGMKETILRSPNIIILCEWSGVYFTQTGQHQKMLDVLNWFKQNKFKFYEMGGGERPCEYAPWIQQSLQQVMTKQTYPDILFAPQHINPNKFGL